MNDYVNRLCEDIRLRGEEYGGRYHVDTVFIGGGTPSLLAPQQIGRILEALSGSFSCGCEFARECQSRIGSCDGMEVSMEANPGTFDGEYVKAVFGAGVNRLSIGVQSLDDGLLRLMGRIHDSKTAIRALRTAGELGINFNADLIFGIPGQTQSMWEDTLSRTAAEVPKHISFYGLQLEMGTPFYRDYREGKLDLPSREAERAMYRTAVDMLGASGYARYEISNAALAGYECRHNLKYWTMRDYLGIGMAAHSFISGRRSFSTSSLSEYLSGPAAAEQEEGSERDLKTDFVFTRLRLTEGFDKEDYASMFACGFDEDFGEPCGELVREGFMEDEGGFVKLTEKGIDFINPVMERLLNA